MQTKIDQLGLLAAVCDALWPALHVFQTIPFAAAPASLIGRSTGWSVHAGDAPSGASCDDRDRIPLRQKKSRYQEAREAEEHETAQSTNLAGLGRLRQWLNPA